MNRPSKGIIIYLATMFAAWILNVTQLWNMIFESLLKIGLKNSQSTQYIEDIFIKNQASSDRWIGVIFGGIISFVVILGIFKLKSWARKLLLFFTSLGIIIYVFNMPRLLVFYKNIVTEKLWLGYYLFAALILLTIAYLISILIFFSRNDIKTQFN